MARKTISTKTKSTSKPPGESLTANKFVDELRKLHSKAELVNVQRFFRGEDNWNKFIGMRMGNIFALAKKFSAMPLSEVDKLLQNDFYEARMGGVSIMDFQARNKKITDDNRKKLYDLYLKRHARINNWDLIDRSAPYVIGGYLLDKSRAPLYKLARSKNVWERRTAIVSTAFFIRHRQIDDTFAIAELLVDDPHDLIHKAVGSWVREAGKRDQQMLTNFLDAHAATMPRVMLRYAIEKLDKKLREHYLGLSEGVAATKK